MLLREFIRHQRHRILHVCEHKMAALGPLDFERASTLASTLDDIVAALADRRAAPNVGGAPLRHGEHLQRSGRPIELVVHDYSSLCDAIMAVAIERDQTFASSDYQLLNLVVDEAIAESIGQFFSVARESYEKAAVARLGVLAHEIRNALLSATFSFEAIEQGRVAPRGKTSEVLKRSLARMGDLVAQALTATKLEAGVPLDRRRLDLGALLDDVVANAVPARGVGLRLERAGDLDVDGDANLLVSAVVNLVQNAIKFTHDAGNVVVRSFARDDRAVVEVEDECGGLPTGRADDLFRPFVQRSRDRSGVGLGLAIARDIVVAHGGTISVRDIPGKGCVFAVALPSPAPRTLAP